MRTRTLRGGGATWCRACSVGAARGGMLAAITWIGRGKEWWRTRIESMGKKGGLERRGTPK